MKMPVNCLTTSTSQIEGFGSNYLFLIATYALARRFGCFYTHTPLKHSVYSHAQKYGFDETGDKEINDFILNCLFPRERVMSIYGEVHYINHVINNPNNRVPIESPGEIGGEHIVHCPKPLNLENAIEGSDIEYVNAPPQMEEIRKILEKPSIKNRVVRIFGDFWDLWRLTSKMFGKDPSLYSDIREELIDNYHKSPHAPPTYFHKNEINIAIHTRRFCCPPDRPSDDVPHRMFFSLGSPVDLFFRSWIRVISKKLSNHAVCFHFYGQATHDSVRSEYDHFVEDLFDKKKHRIETHLNERPTIALHHLIAADILFVSPWSAFSYIAQFYSKGIVFVRDGFPGAFAWTDSLLPHLHVVNLNGTFDETLLDKLLTVSNQN